MTVNERSPSRSVASDNTLAGERPASTEEDSEVTRAFNEDKNEEAAAHHLSAAGDLETAAPAASDDTAAEQAATEAAAEAAAAAAAEHAAVEVAMRATADPLPIGPGEWQGGAPSVAQASAQAPPRRTPSSEPKREPTMAEAVAELGLTPVGRDDWIQYFAREAHNPDRQAELITNCAFADDECGRDGMLFSQTPDACMYCMELTTQCFPCAGAHKVCHRCRAENQEDRIERCHVCRSDFVVDEAINPAHATKYDRTFEKAKRSKLARCTRPLHCCMRALF